MDMDMMTVPAFGAEYEIYDPINAWAGAPTHIYAQVCRMHQGVYQMGWDPDADAYWLRWKRGDTGTWGDWVALAPPPIEPPPPEERENIRG